MELLELKEIDNLDFFLYNKFIKPEKMAEEGYISGSNWVVGKQATSYPYVPRINSFKNSFSKLETRS